MYIHAATQDFENLLLHTPLLENYPKDEFLKIMKDNCEALDYILENSFAPNAKFNYLGNGAFKEAYTLIGAEDVIIKFFCEDNATDREIDLLEDAGVHGVDGLFIPTYFVWLGQPIPAAYLGSDEPEYFCTEREDSQGNLYWTTTTNPDYYEYELIGFELQPKCTVYRVFPRKELEIMSWESKESFDSYEYKSLKINDYLLYRDMYETTTNADWWENIHQRFGWDMIKKFLQFVKDRHISDLHNGNIGFHEVEGVRFPIILDWLSN